MAQLIIIFTYQIMVKKSPYKQNYAVNKIMPEESLKCYLEKFNAHSLSRQNISLKRTKYDFKFF